ATRGNPRWVAHRPLPSMMTATCLGTGWARTSSRSSCSLRVSQAPGEDSLVESSAMGPIHRSLEGEDFLLLFLEQLVDLCDVLVRGLLDRIVATPFLVF